MATDEVLDPAVVVRLRQAQEAFGNPEFIRQLAGLFQARTPRKMERIRLAIAGGDAGAVREVAHALKSNCGMLGASRLTEACGRMEEAAARADLAAATEAFQEAEQLLPAVLAALSTLE